MLYFVNAETKDRIEYDDNTNRIFGKKELPVDLNEIAQQIIKAKWETFYAMTDNKRSGTYKNFDTEDIASYLGMSLAHLTSQH